ncbi:MAG: sigma-54-dependent transcriptional regulator [Acidobacteriota bacterium]
MARVLVVDDEKNIRATVCRALELEGHETAQAADGDEALERLDGGGFDLALVDLSMPRRDGDALLDAMRERGDSTGVIILTAHATVERAVAALRRGAYDFLSKPVDRERLCHAVAQAVEHARLHGQILELREDHAGTSEMIGSGALMDDMRERIARAAPSDGRILLTGENGTGKELAARAIHQLSPRKEQPFVRVNCAAIPETLFESELFGHVQGAFTDARRHHKGRFERAHRGTLFLDEIAEMPVPMQAKLLRVIETGEMERVGGGREIVVDVRLIAATHKNLDSEVAAGRFRQDLFYRLNVVPIHVPALRDHKQDIPRLAATFLAACCRRNGYLAKTLTPGAVERLAAHDYPGNVRELRNAMERLAILVPGRSIEASDVADVLPAVATVSARADGEPGEDDSLKTRLARYERGVVRDALEKSGWRMAATARALVLERSHLYKKMKALGIRKPD